MGKTLHQRNKSTPALSTLLQPNGIKANAKRTAFADVSNTVRNNQPVKDDLALPKKGAFEVLKSNANVNLDFVKPAPLARPAQRPLSTVTLKAAGVVAPEATAPSLPTVNTVDSSSQVGILRKVQSKATLSAAAKEQPLNAEKVPAPVLPDVRRVSSLAPVHQLLAAPALNKATTDTKVDITEVQTATASISAIVRPEPAKLSIIPPHTSEQLPPLLEEQDQENVLHSQGDHAPLPQLPAEELYIEALEQQATAIEQIRNEELAKQLQPLPISEPEEYWDEEEDEEYFETDGYTTARSIRSRGENTTGGVTLVLAPRVTSKSLLELEAARLFVESTKSPEDIEDEQWDTSMVAEYGDEIFSYMKTLEDRMRPNPLYMENQAEIQWSMRSVLMDWLVQVHHRFSLLPETLFLAVNYVDRFLSSKVVSLGKLQLVGATAIFLAAKYEEINCPSVQEIVYMVDGGYTVDEILKAERFMLSMLQFELGWPGPMSFLRRISKADDYDLESRTLAKYFLEITVMDERFVGCVPSFTAAAAHCLARFMLKKGDWSQAHVHYSQYTYAQLRQLISVIVECCEDAQKHHQAVYEKYADKRFKRASLYVEAEMRNGFVLPQVTRDSQTWKRKLSAF